MKSFVQRDRVQYNNNNMKELNAFRQYLTENQNEVESKGEDIDKLTQEDVDVLFSKDFDINHIKGDDKIFIMGKWTLSRGVFKVDWRFLENLLQDKNILYDVIYPKSKSKEFLIKLRYVEGNIIYPEWDLSK